MVKLPERRAAEADETLRTFCCAIPKVRFDAATSLRHPASWRSGRHDQHGQEQMPRDAANACAPKSTQLTSLRLPQARVAPPELWCSHPDTSLVNSAANRAQALTQARGPGGLDCLRALHPAQLSTLPPCLLPIASYCIFCPLILHGLVKTCTPCLPLAGLVCALQPAAHRAAAHPAIFPGPPPDPV